MPTTAAPRRLGVLLAVYLFGIFMGALDTGIVRPARTIIQNDLGVDDQAGIWMLTIYTLAYAASIPVMGKLADRYGRKPIYLQASPCSVSAPCCAGSVRMSAAWAS